MKTFRKTILVFIVIFIGIIAPLVLAEIIFTAYFTLKDGEYISVKNRLINQKNLFVREIIPLEKGKNECNYLDTFFPHPYLGFVHHNNKPCDHLLQTNNIGLYGNDYPDEKLKDYYVILVTGGSVAARFAQIFEGGPRYLEHFLNNRYVPPHGKGFLVLNGGEGAWSYPQQVILFILYAAVIDAVITIDGYNEIFNIKSGMRLEYPSSNFLRINPFLNSGNEELLAVWITNEIYNYSLNHPILSRSYLSYFLSTRIRNKMAAGFTLKEKQDDKNITVESIFSLPDEWDDEKKFKYNIEQYKKYIRMINYISREMMIKTAHFIQPVPAIGKELSFYEKSVVGDLSYGKDYLRMTAELLKLHDEQIPIYSLLNLLEDEKETIYGDLIHFYHKLPDYLSPGNRLMAEEISKIIGKQWNLNQQPR